MADREEAYITMEETVKSWLDHKGVPHLLRIGYHNLARQVFAAKYRYHGKILDSQCAFYKFLWISRGLHSEVACELADFVLSTDWETEFSK